MELTFREISDWPKLAWVASCPEQSRTLKILHGSAVEVADEWCVEAVWAEPFSHAGFDLTDLVFGTGIRRRANHVVFVSSGSPLDRLWYCHHKGQWVFTNSFPALLMVSGLTLLPTYRYDMDIQSINKGLNGYTRTVPLQQGQAHLVYFNNIEFDGTTICEVSKPDSAWDFSNFDDYFWYLQSAADRIGENLRACERTHQVTPFVPISSGFDSPVAAILARQAGCRLSATIENSRAMFNKRSDSGEAIATHLNMTCQVHTRIPTEFEHEEMVWAASGKASDLNLTIFEYPGPLTLLFGGYWGDTIWGRNSSVPLERDPFIGYPMIGSGISEFRLLKGIFNCPVPFWGIRHIGAIRKITASAEMAPYRFNTPYDRPIPRRIIEMTGVPRGSFAVRKSATSIAPVVRYPLSSAARERFCQYLVSRGRMPTTDSMLEVLELRNQIDLMFKKIFLNKRWRQKLSFSRQPNGSSLLFHWAIQETTQQYQAYLFINA